MVDALTSFNLKQFSTICNMLEILSCDTENATYSKHSNILILGREIPPKKITSSTFLLCDLVFYLIVTKKSDSELFENWVL